MLVKVTFLVTRSFYLESVTSHYRLLYYMCFAKDYTEESQLIGESMRVHETQRFDNPVRCLISITLEDSATATITPRCHRIDGTQASNRSRRRSVHMIFYYVFIQSLRSHIHCPLIKTLLLLQQRCTRKQAPAPTTTRSQHVLYQDT